jgi:hypothetical protein
MSWKVLEIRWVLRRIADAAMSWRAVLFIAVLSSLPASAAESPSADTGAVPVSNGVLSRDAIVPLTVITRLFPEITQEKSTGQNSTAVGKPKATRSVIYANSDNTKKVTITVDQYASSSDASTAYAEAVQKSKTVPGFKPISAPNLSTHAFMGTVTQGTETHIGLGAVRDTLIVGATLVGFDKTPEITANLISLAHDEENAAAATVTPPLSAATDKIDALVQSQIADGKTPGIAVAIAKNGHTIYENSVGVRDVSSHAPMLITTPQAIGSITKQFTAAGILLLQQEKKLSIEDKLSINRPLIWRLAIITRSRANRS